MNPDRGGAALDVAPIEPLPAHPLWIENVVMTPHTAGASQLTQLTKAADLER